MMITPCRALLIFASLRYADADTCRHAMLPPCAMLLLLLLFTLLRAVAAIYDAFDAMPLS